MIPLHNDLHDKVVRPLKYHDTRQRNHTGKLKSCTLFTHKIIHMIYVQLCCKPIPQKRESNSN